MKKSIRLFTLFLTFTLLFLQFIFPTVAAEVPASVAFPASAPTVSAQSAILLEADSMQVLYEYHSEEKLPMASTTKIVTALTALNAFACEQIITVSADAVGIEGSSIYLTAGEQLTLEQLLYALLLESANDAAAAIAIGVGGSIEAFADMMNDTAEVIGVQNSHFCNPHGLDNEQHYTTALDLAVITSVALQNKKFAEIVATKKTTIPHAGTDGVRLLVNHNKLLRIYDGAIGVKTGFTKKSGRCLVSAAEKDGVRLICVTLNDPNDWLDHENLFDYGFSLCEKVSLCKEGEISVLLPVVGGEISETLLSNDTSVDVTLLKGHGEVRYIIESQRFLFAPVFSEEPAAYAVFYCDTNGDGYEEKIATVPLTVKTTVFQTEKKFNLWEWITSVFKKHS